MMKRICLLLFILIGLMAACGQPNHPSGAADEGDAYPYSTAVPGTSGKRMTLSVGLDGFVSANDAVGDILIQRLNIDLLPVDVNEHDVAAMETLEAAGALPDVLRVDIRERYFARWVTAGVIRDLPVSRSQKFPVLQERMDASDELQAVAQLHKKRQWFVPVSDTDPYLSADSGRIYYRKDWLAELELAEPDTPEALAAMLTAFKDEKKAAGITLAGGVTYLLTLFGTDPESWILENGEWIPAFYSDRMLEGLRFARSLYENKVLDGEYAINKTNTAIYKLADGTAGALVRHGDAYWMARVFSAFAEQNGISAADSYAQSLGILPPPGTWPRAVETGGVVIAASVSDEKLNRILAMLSFTLSEEGQELAYFGLRNETSAKGADGVLKLLIDPETARPIDIWQRYPAARLLFILDRSRARLGEHDASIPSDLPPALKDACYAAAAAYNACVVDEGDGFLIRFMTTPAKSALEAAIDPGAAFNVIVTGTAPVEEMFAAFQAECREKNIRTAINEVNALMP